MNHTVTVLGPSEIWALLLVMSVGSLINLYCLRIYRPASDKAINEGARWLERFAFSPELLGGFSYWLLALVSFLALFFELLMIRWISSEIGIFAYLKNFVLIACFLGFGLGCYLSRLKINLAATLMPLMALTILCTLPWSGLQGLVDTLPNLLGPASRVDVWGLPSFPRSVAELFMLASAVLFIVPSFGLIACSMIPLGQLVGWCLENAKNGISAYTVNIIGSLAGIALFTLLSFMFLPPAIWFLLTGASAAGIFWKLPSLRWACVAVFLTCAGLASLGPGKGSKVLWSPYQKLTVTPFRQNGEIVSYGIKSNTSWHQQIFNLSPNFVASHPWFFKIFPAEYNPYNLPYHFYPSPPSVLVLGAGTGNDVAAALRNGARRVVAVEIDPLVLNLGKQLHFEQPYASSRVHVVLNDARSYIQNSSERFDLIIFSLLDSLTTSSYYTNIRIDNYVYTLEAIAATSRLLKPDGILVLKIVMVHDPAQSSRLAELEQAVFDSPPLVFQTVRPVYTAAARFFIDGSQSRIARALLDPRLAAYVNEGRIPTIAHVPLTTDDWPYLYQHEPGMPASVIVISTMLIMLCGFFLRETGTPLRALRWHFFFLGAGFLILEAQIISRMALFFGTTWLVNSIVIAAILVMIVAANLLVQWKPSISYMSAYGGIFASILIGYLVPIESFFFSSVWVKGLTAAFILCLPVFFAGIVFIRSFAREGFQSEALGSNLFGALVGGMLESISMWTGMRSLLILAGLLYLASLIAMRFQSRVTDAPKVAGLEIKLMAAGSGN